ncbi:MAG: helix-turn-helix domain-containing protein, partial [Burkholderiales bacterium]
MNTQITWTEADLVRLIEGRASESLTLDFKACEALSPTDSKKNELRKDVAAMANSAGGVLI